MIPTHTDIQNTGYDISLFGLNSSSSPANELSSFFSLLKRMFSNTEDVIEQDPDFISNIFYDGDIIGRLVTSSNITEVLDGIKFRITEQILRFSDILNVEFTVDVFRVSPSVVGVKIYLNKYPSDIFVVANDSKNRMTTTIVKE